MTKTAHRRKKCVDIYVTRIVILIEHSGYVIVRLILFNVEYITVSRQSIERNTQKLEK